jgi:hypothetical protein
MPVHPRIRAVFGHFQNLNLLALLHDLASGQTTKWGWSSGSFLCPVAHGLPARQDVMELNILGQTQDLIQGCYRAAHRLGADPAAVLEFVRSWDEGTIAARWLFSQLEELWYERLEDAVTFQAVLQGQNPPSQAWDEDGCDGVEDEWLPNSPG